MKPLDELAAAGRGWSALLAGDSAAGRHFVATPAGLAVALGSFLLAVLLASAVQSAAGGLPSAGVVIAGLMAQAVVVALLAVAIAQARRVLRIEGATTLDLLVPMVYALAAMVVVAIPLALLGPNVSLIAMLALAGLIYREGRVLAGMRPGAALGFALLCLLVLVVVPNALYMVILHVPSPA